MKKFTPRWIALALEYHLLKKDKALLGAFIPKRLQSVLRRRARAKYLIWDARPYNKWMAAHLQRRSTTYQSILEPGLLSIATPVWDGTPIPYLQVLTQSIASQNAAGACEWLVLDNGCTKPDIRGYLQELASNYPWIKVHREATNQGIVGGMRACLEHATGRYLCTVDSDDLLYPDCLQIVQWWIRQSGYPPLLYSDEDKIIGSQAVQPYFKPDFDPVLLLNSAYIAHLGVVERDKALALNVYSDRDAEGSPDWDLFVRFYLAGHQPIHIPEVIYSWRMHPESTADDTASKPYIERSQRAVLGRFLEAKGLSTENVLRHSPLLPHTVDFWIERKHVNPLPAVLFTKSSAPLLNYPGLTSVSAPDHLNFAAMMSAMPNNAELVCVMQSGLKPERDDCLWEAQGLFERFSDAGMVGGWIANRQGAVQDGPLLLGFNGGCGCPDLGRPAVDPGYFTQLRKQHSVSAISSRFAVFRKHFLQQAFEHGDFSHVCVWNLGPWLGEFARNSNWRIIFSPFLQCKEESDAISPEPHGLPSFQPDRRFYPAHFGLTPQTSYQLIPDPE